MAELKVMDEFVGPGEKKTAERLAADLPASWVIYAGRKLAGPNKDDVDLIVVGQSLIFTLEEKAWGPTIVVGDIYWTVKGDHRHSPGAQVATVAKKLAGLLRKGAKGYDALKGKRVLAAVVLSHDNVQVIATKNHDYNERIWPLPIAADELMALDKRESPLGAARPAVITYLDGLSPAEKRNRIGEYKILSQIPAAGREQAFEARSTTGQRVVLKCYPIEQLKQLGDPMEYLARETKAINRVAEFGRTWAALPPFESPAHGFYVVPVVPPSVGWTLEQDIVASKTTRDGGLIGVNDATVVVRNAFEALKDVHDEELTHRALHPRRIWLGKNRLVKFSDFHLARISGEETISPWADFDISEDYRAPEAAADVGLATYESDVYSLTLALSTWLLGKDAADVEPEELRATIAGVYPWADTFLSGLSFDFSARPSAAEMAEAIELPPVEPAVSPTPAADDFRVGGLVGGRYQVREELGVGGFARTWKVYDKNIDLPRVLKQFHTLVPEKLRSEFLAAHELNHEKCGRVFDMQLDLDPAYLVSEYVEGQSLRHPGVDRSIHEVRTIALDVLEALDYIHKKGRVHGDVTPSNVIVATDGSGNSKLIDFGLAVPIGEKAEGWSPQFAAPEVMKAGAATPAGDLFGFAATMCYVMLGRAATKYEAGVVRLIAPTDVELATWGQEGSLLLKSLLRGLADTPSERPASASEFRELVTSARIIELPQVAGGDRDRGLEPLDLARQINPNVTSIRRLYRAAAGGNAGNRGLDDEFANATYVPTLLDLELLPRVMDKEFKVVLLSGNPGDGKTSVLVKLGDQLRTQGASVVYEDAAGWALRLDGHTFYAIFDASESHGDLTSDDLVRRALEPVLDGEPATALIAINDGRMLQFFVDNSHDFQEWWFSIDDQLAGEPYNGSGVVLVDLKKRTLARSGSAPGLARRVLDTMTAKPLWAICDSCVAQTSCPLLANRNLLTAKGADTFDELMQISHLRRRRRATFRDVRSSIAWILTGNKTCEDIHAYASNDLNPLYWDDTAAYDLAFSRESNDYLVGEWADLDPATVAAPAVDRLWRSIKSDPRKAFLNSPQRIARAIYFGLDLVEDPGAAPADLRVFRYLDEFTTMLAGEDPVATKSRILLGISRLVGAFGYAGTGLAMSSGAEGAAWAILHTVPAEQFTVITPAGRSEFIEMMADTIMVAHTAGPTLNLTLDTAEVILRAADGEIINDLASEAIRQEIDSFVNQLKRQPSHVAQIVDSSGSVATARITGSRIELEAAK